MPESVTAVRRYLTFRSAARHYALPAEEVAEIILMPAVARLPQSPAALLGMANLRGSVIAVASLRGLLGQEAAAPGKRAILLSGAAPVAISVDRVDALVTVDAKQIETRQAELAADAGERLRGAFQPAPHAEISKILDIQTLLAAAFQPVGRAVRNIAKTAEKLALLEPPGEALRMLLSFEIGGQEYALPMQDVREIVQLPANIAAVPGSEALLLGVVSLRGTVLPLLSLRGLLGMPSPATLPEAAKIIVTMVAGVPAGLVADRVKAVIAAPAERVSPAPAMLAARMGGEARIGAIYREETGRIVSILAVESLFGDEVMARLSRLNQQHEAAERINTATGPVRQFLVFRLGEEEFGLPVAAVVEVAAMPEKITRVPKTPKFLEGVVNLRGEVLPVIDQRRRFDLPEQNREDAGKRRLLVARTERHRAALLVDGISGVVSAPEAEIAPAPLLAGETVSMISGVLNLPAAGRIILLLDPDELLTRTERGLLDNFSSRQK